MQLNPNAHSCSLMARTSQTNERTYKQNTGPFFCVALHSPFELHFRHGGIVSKLRRIPWLPLSGTGTGYFIKRTQVFRNVLFKRAGRHARRWASALQQKAAGSSPKRQQQQHCIRRSRPTVTQFVIKRTSLHSSSSSSRSPTNFALGATAQCAD